MKYLLEKTAFFKILVAILLIAGMQTSCSDDKDNTEKDDLSATISSTSPDAQGQTLTLSITSKNSATWNILIPSEDQTWITPQTTSGIGDATVEIIITKNDTDKARFSKITVENGATNVLFYISQSKHGDPIEVPDDLKWFEIPAKTDLPNTVTIAHMMPEDSKIRNYSMLYDTDNRLAYWVAYPMNTYYTGSADRTDQWGYDPKVSPNLQPTLFSGFGISQIDRGHQLPSADRTSSRAANVTTFYFTNMTAQNSNLNQGVWASLEGKVRKWMANCDTLYVVTGAMITTASDKAIDYVTDNDGKRVAKPKYYYKALAQKKGDTYYTLGFRFDNKSHGTGASYDTYRVTVKDLEDETGFVFFPALTESVKSTIVTAQWK